MATYTAQVVIHTTSNIPKDFITNTFHFTASGDAAGEDAIIAGLTAFYNAVRSVLSNLIPQGGHEIKLYDTDAPRPKLPLREVIWAFSGAPAGVPYPTEVSIVSSFRGQNFPGVPLASTRGRIYLGPINASIGGTDARVLPATRNLIRDAALALARPSPGVTQIIFSPTRDASYAVVSGFVDNEFDTQRRRGRKATDRTVWTVLA